MTNNEKIEFAVDLLNEVVKDWDESKVIKYPDGLPSFDELVAKMGGIWIEN